MRLDTINASVALSDKSELQKRLTVISDEQKAVIKDVLKAEPLIVDLKSIKKS